MAVSLPLSFRLQPSRYAAAALAVVHGLALATIAASGFDWRVSVLLAGVVLMSCVASLRLHALRSARHAIVACVLRDGGEVELERRDGHRFDARIDVSSTVSYWLVALQLREGSRRRSLLLLPDMMDADSWRRLAVVLRARRNAA